MFYSQILSEERIKMKVKFAEANSAFTNEVKTKKGTSIAKFLADNDVNTSDVVVMVNGKTVPSDYTLKKGDAIQCSPRKVGGSRD